MSAQEFLKGRRVMRTAKSGRYALCGRISASDRSSSGEMLTRAELESQSTCEVEGLRVSSLIDKRREVGIEELRAAIVNQAPSSRWNKHCTERPADRRSCLLIQVTYDNLNLFA